MLHALTESASNQTAGGKRGSAKESILCFNTDERLASTLIVPQRYCKVPGWLGPCQSHAFALVCFVVDSSSILIGSAMTGTAGTEGTEL